jgi:hypothetical protein
MSPTPFHRFLLPAALAAALGAAGESAVAQTQPAVAPQPPDTSLGAALWDKARAYLHLRTYYFDSDPEAGSRATAWAAGGWLGYESGRWMNRFSIGAEYFLSLPVWAPDDRDGTRLLEPGQDPISALGIAYARWHLTNDDAMTFYRQYVDVPNVNRNDNRMVPRTFEGVSLGGKAGSFDYLVGWFDRTKVREQSSFQDFATVAGARGAPSEDLWLGWLAWQPATTLRFQVSDHYVDNIFNTFYIDGAWTIPLAGDSSFVTTAQYMDQRSTGENLIGDFDTWVAGIKADWDTGPLTLTLAYQQTGSGNKFQSPYGGFAGYQSMLISDFDRASEKAWMIEGACDLSPKRDGTLTVSASYNYGRDARDPSTGARLSDDQELDLGLTWRPYLGGDASRRPLSVDLKYGWLDSRSYPTEGETNQYRIIVNYEIPLK